ncbi:protein of unknown function [Blastococcus saxobsidens DD2]|uniref:Uncharacterized protein n=1 Tax=Blastococcus saxobsidens (strain DD2) TaxID=1146883 RepID=H6RN39_BLASD|nr:protein of unknown function [Blastococcus saxobsidens DD2]
MESPTRSGVEGPDRRRRRAERAVADQDSRRAASGDLRPPGADSRHTRTKPRALKPRALVPPDRRRSLQQRDGLRLPLRYGPRRVLSHPVAPTVEEAVRLRHRFHWLPSHGRVDVRCRPFGPARCRLGWIFDQRRE